MREVRERRTLYDLTSVWNLNTLTHAERLVVAGGWGWGSGAMLAYRFTFSYKMGAF